MSIFYNIPPPDNTLATLLQQANDISNTVTHTIAQISGSTQCDTLYNLTHQKNLRVRSLRERFCNLVNPPIYLTDHIFHAVELKDNMHRFNLNDRIEPFVDSIVIFSNNNVMVNNNISRYIQLWLSSPTSIFVIWDFDNHHCFSLSSMLAAASDLYVPTHSDNLEPLSRYNNIMMGPVGCGVIQWSKQFLKEHAAVVGTTQRSDEPYGTHIAHPQFPYRNKNLQMLTQQMPNVKLVDSAYHSRDKLDRLREWCTYKVHWIVPVLNDAPIRVYDALITGGIPIAPRSIKYHRDIVALHKHMLFYDYEDVKNPLTISEKGVKMFNELREEGVLQRHSCAIDGHHVDNRVQTILQGVYDEFGIS